MRFPFDTYRLGTRYGQKGRFWKCGWHSGLDLCSANYGGNGVVYPIQHGNVIKASWSESYGNYLVVKHPDGYVSLYAHLKSVFVQKGDMVSERTALGIEGMTGHATGKHLHLEVHKGEYKYPSTIDPYKFLKERMEVSKVLKISLNGVKKQVQAIEHAGFNYVRLQDLRDERIAVEYDAAEKMPVIKVK